MPPRHSWFRAMHSRDQQEPHRVSTSLELLFDLTFVVAVASIAARLAHSLAESDLAAGLEGYLMVFFAIWWAWMNFTWFASAFDVDDWFYRVVTLIQMAGVLVLAAGVPAAFDRENFAGITVGYVVMRLAMVVQWIRAAASDERYRRTALRYALGITVVQAGWVARLAVPADLATPAFLVLVLAELAVPVLAERGNMTPWHPHHVAERYGLFTIIVLGESVTAASNAVSGLVRESGVTLDLVMLSTGGLLLLFGMWWLYFLHPTGEALAVRRQLSFVWGYSQYVVAGALAAVGAALEAAAEYALHAPVAGSHESSEVSGVDVAMAVAVSVSIFLLVTGAVHGSLTRGHVPRLRHAGVTAVVLVVLAAFVGDRSVPLAVLACGVTVAGLVVVAVLSGSRTAAAT